MDELELVRQVELKLLIVDDPARFAQAIDLYLCPLLLKLASPRHEVRSAVLRVLQGVNPRLEGVPLDKLLAQLAEPLPPLVKRVNLSYVKRGLPGSNLAPRLLGRISAQPQEIASLQFSYFLTALATSAPARAAPADEEFLLKWTTNLLLMDLKQGQSPGLTLEEHRFLAVDLTEAKLSASKAKLVQWLELVENKPLLYCALVVAQHDRLSEVYGPAKQLFKSFGKDSPPPQLADLLVPSRTRAPAKPSLCVKILELYARSDAPLALVEVCRAAFTDQQWAQAALALLRNRAPGIDAATKKQLCTVLHDYLYTLETSYGGSDALRGSGYETLGMLVCEYDLRLLSFLLQKLERDSLSLVASIQSALSAFKNPEASQLPELQQLLVRVFYASSRDATKLACLKLAYAFPFEHAPSRLMALVAQLGTRSDVQDEGRRATDPSAFANPKFPALSSMLALDPTPCGPVAAFLFQCAAAEAGVRAAPSAFWATCQHDDAARQKLARHDCTAIFAYALDGLLADDPQCVQVWTLLLRTTPRALLLQQSQYVNALLGAPTPSAVVAESVALMHPDPEGGALDFAHTPSSALLFAYLCKERGVRPSGLYQYCLDAKLWEALYQLALAGAVPDPLALLDIGTSEPQMLLLGALSLWADPLPFIDKLLAVSQNSKNIDYLLANGEALAMCVSGWDSKLLEGSPTPGTQRTPGTSTLIHTLKIVFAQTKASPIIRRYACVRLLCLCRYCDVRNHASDIQRAFLLFLSDADEISQECASQGLGILYEQNPSKDMVRELVQLFTGEHKPLQRGRISEETQLFEPGALPTGTGSGSGSVSTYKDVLNLANEVGDASLVYKFMSLASTSQIWATKRGAAFGLESIMAKADLELELGHLVPKLFRYQFDANKQVQATMKSIWDAIVKDRQAAIAQHFDEIVAELFSGAQSYEWRVRQASASAFASLVETTDWARLEPHAEPLWTTAFRTVDDIKDSVRAAGFGLTRALVASLVRRLDADARGTSELLQVLVPFLFSTRGVHSDSEEVRAFALDALLKIAKSPSPKVRPLRLSMMQQFVLLLSDLEPQALNYIALNSQNYGVQNEQVDDARLQGVRTSPISDTVQRMIEALSGDELNAALAEWPAVVQRVVGLPSEIGASAAVVAMCMRFPTGDPAALVKACLKQLSNRNPAVAQSYAAALAYLARLSDLPHSLQLVEHVAGVYFEGEDAARLVAAQFLGALSKHASDRFSALSALVLPLSYIGRTDGSPPVAAAFEGVWFENTGSESVRLYAREIVDMALPRLQSASWNIRKAAARALAGALEHAPGDPQPILAALQGRTWPGKELLFRALCESSQWLEREQPELVPTIHQRALNELQRNNTEYVVAIIPSIVILLQHQFSTEIYQLFYSRLGALIEAEPAESKITLFKAAVDAYRQEHPAQLPFDAMYDTWKTKQALCEGLAALKGRLFDGGVWSRCCAECGRDPSELVRQAWASAAATLEQLATPAVAEILAVEQSPAVRAKAGL